MNRSSHRCTRRVAAPIVACLAGLAGLAFAAGCESGRGTVPDPDSGSEPGAGPGCTAEFFATVDARLPISDAEGHGPDPGSDEWRHVAQFHLARVAVDGPAAPIGNDAWCDELARILESENLVAAFEARDELDATVARHFAAIRARDLDALSETLTDGDSLILILPDGTQLQTRAEYTRLHAEWFADPGWTMEIEPLSTVFRPKLALISVRTTMLDDRPDSGRQFFLTLTFAREPAGWRLVFDQNTPIPKDNS